MFRIVVIEDEDLLRKGLVITTPWDECECQVVGEATNGLEGLELIKKLKPDIVFTDIKMSGLDGLSMIRKAKEFVNDTEFIILSGYNEFDYARQAIKLGVKEYLLKPIDHKQLIEVLLKIIRDLKEKKELKKLLKLEQIGYSKIMLFEEYIAVNETNCKEDYVRKAINYIKERFNDNIGISDAANHLHISESYLSRLFKLETNYTFIEYLTEYRIKKALELLKDKTIKVYEVASLVGYKDSRYFSMIFKKYVGVTPTEFRDGLN